MAKNFDKDFAMMQRSRADFHYMVLLHHMEELLSTKCRKYLTLKEKKRILGLQQEVLCASVYNRRELRALRGEHYNTKR